MRKALKMFIVLLAGTLIVIAFTGKISLIEAVGPAESGFDHADANHTALKGDSHDKNPAQSLSNRLSGALTALLGHFGVNKEFAALYALWIVGAPGLVLLIMIFMLLRPRRKPAHYRPNVMEPENRRTLSRRNTLSTRYHEIKAATLSDKQRVLRFFFQLFKDQVACKPDAPTELYLVEKRTSCPDETYEMRIQQNGDWISRRMSIGLLGQGGGSRSRCFLVTYDSHLVVKLPADPITNFYSYNRRIAEEAAIVARLAPRECIVPKVSVILKAVHSFAQEDSYTSEALEKKYVHLVEVKPAFQDYLKIGASFAFFMDLARHFFLSTTIEEIHASRNASLVDEALAHQELLWDHHSFVCRYGEEAGTVCHYLQEAYYRCEKQLRTLVDEAAIVEDVPAFKLKQWFLIHLAGGRIDAAKVDLPSPLLDKINALLKQTMAENSSTVNTYRRRLKAYIFNTRFSQHRTQLESLATNTLDLLAWIGEKGLALRDLKPENLFVAGNPDDYPLFLADATNFSIGLIDVETAIVMDVDDPGDLPQPQLAGTPLYATPTHLISNTILRELYPDLPGVFHAQDWFATMAIIYKIVTGKNLFPSTARVFPEILKRLKLVDPAGPDLASDIAAISRLFWNSAIAEFQEAVRKQYSLLARVEIVLPKKFVKKVINALHRDIDQINRTISQRVTGQSFFPSQEKRRYLLDASAEKIRQMKHKLISDSQKAQQYEAILSFFKHLQLLKGHLERKLEAAALLKVTKASITADQLLEAMFQHVFSIMYLPDWPAMAPAKWQGNIHLPADITAYQATL